MSLLSISLLWFLCCLIIKTTFISKTSADLGTTSQRFFYFCDQNNERGNYTAKSNYARNLNTLLSTLTSNTRIDYGFYNSSYDENKDKVNAIGLCRGDIKPEECRGCLDQAKANITQLCPNRKEAIGWYQDEKCMLRYSDRTIFGLNETEPAYYMCNMNNATDADKFNGVVKNLSDKLRRKAAAGDSRRKYGAGTAVDDQSNKTVYGVVQCTPDLSEAECDSCLVESIKGLLSLCNDKIGARMVRPSCYHRYETYSFLFYDPSTHHPSPSPSPSPFPAPPSPKAATPSPSSSLLPPSVPSARAPSSPPSDPLSSPTPSFEGVKTSSTTVTTVPSLLLLGSFLFVST
ncbi:cysteine-rich receptor-like protein kinase 29 [Arachis duranensis]|uniref:Cysteine-rich receptor-like protein kinase 29 n=1 Tax=Arachis duranensis TaxID=130453 RepID=A0A6P4BKS3_ARADU|nr:cysteine-rich receptor-like protein kinase 29 [Arachis duranensis]